MKLTATREEILAPVQNVIGVVERRQTMPVLSNVLLTARDGKLSVTGTDLEVELVSSISLKVAAQGEITVPGRKFLDILRALPEGVNVTLSIESDRLVVRAGRSRFTLSTLAAAEFPLVDEINAQQVLKLPQSAFRRLIDKTHFSMAQQDVRYYLNGMLLESEGGTLRAVATDGHRLALCEANLSTRVTGKQQVILPRKGVLELQRMLGDEGEVELAVGTNHVRCTIGEIRFTSKLIDGRFPEYSRVIPAHANRVIDADRNTLKQSLQRTAILSNEKYRGIRLNAKPNLLTLQAHNPEQEEAEDQLEVSYQGEELEIGFNVTYLLDALAAIETDRVHIALTDSNSSCLVTAAANADAKYVVMPMRL
ncbi:MAG: DNA polymerase III subunit beta [Gammaproteobacteria bacterium]|jgi:DNA polymerase-3 subunit beta|nr:DNA polymerase III subunit beta [Gammaproteobacteria bacterium]NBX39861.1 DNA polymerase III subunit beta [Gammaproteobacteria bacterium]